MRSRRSEPHRHGVRVLQDGAIDPRRSQLSAGCSRTATFRARRCPGHRGRASFRFTSLERTGIQGIARGCELRMLRRIEGGGAKRLTGALRGAAWDRRPARTAKVIWLTQGLLLWNPGVSLARTRLVSGAGPVGGMGSGGPYICMKQRHAVEVFVRSDDRISCSGRLQQHEPRARRRHGLRHRCFRRGEWSRCSPRPRMSDTPPEAGASCASMWPCGYGSTRAA